MNCVTLYFVNSFVKKYLFKFFSRKPLFEYFFLKTKYHLGRKSKTKYPSGKKGFLIRNEIPLRKKRFLNKKRNAIEENKIRFIFNSIIRHILFVPSQTMILVTILQFLYIFHKDIYFNKRLYYDKQHRRIFFHN